MFRIRLSGVSGSSSAWPIPEGSGDHIHLLMCAGISISCSSRSMGRRRFYGVWRAVDYEGEVLDVLLQSRRNKKAALKLLRKLLKMQGFAPDTLVTDKPLSCLCGYAAVGKWSDRYSSISINSRSTRIEETV